MRRSQPARAGIKHLPFFEALADAPEGSAAARSATAGLLAMRMIDHWVMAGSVIVEPESVSVRSARGAIMALDPKDPARDVLLSIVNTMQAVREVDLSPVLPRVFAYGQILDRESKLSLASDVFQSVVTHGSEEYEADLLIDSLLALGTCAGKGGDLDRSEDAFGSARKLSLRARDGARSFRAETGLATVLIDRGNLPKADEMLTALVERCTTNALSDERANALNALSVVAQRRGQLERAVTLAFEAFQSTENPRRRDVILGNIGACFLALEQFDAARDALMILEATASEPRVANLARVNLLAVAGRAGDEPAFRSLTAALAQTQLEPQFEVNVLIESAKALRLFGEPEQALDHLSRARALAEAHGLNRSVFEADELIKVQVAAPAHAKNGGSSVSPHAPAVRVAKQLRGMASALATDSSN